MIAANGFMPPAPPRSTIEQYRRIYDIVVETRPDWNKVVDVAEWAYVHWAYVELGLPEGTGAFEYDGITFVNAELLS